MFVHQGRGRVGTVCSPGDGGSGVYFLTFLIIKGNRELGSTFVLGLVYGSIQGSALNQGSSLGLILSLVNIEKVTTCKQN